MPSEAASFQRLATRRRRDFNTETLRSCRDSLAGLNFPSSTSAYKQIGELHNWAPFSPTASTQLRNVESNRSLRISIWETVALRIFCISASRTCIGSAALGNSWTVRKSACRRSASANIRFLVLQEARQVFRSEACRSLYRILHRKMLIEADVCLGIQLSIEAPLVQRVMPHHILSI